MLHCFATDSAQIWDDLDATEDLVFPDGVPEHTKLCWPLMCTLAPANAASIVVVLHDPDREAVPRDCTKPDGLFCGCSSREAFAS